MLSRDVDIKWIDVHMKIPIEQVLAIGYQQQMLVGYCYDDGEGWYCESGYQRLDGVTHYINLNDLILLHGVQFPVTH